MVLSGRTMRYSSSSNLLIYKLLDLHLIGLPYMFLCK